MPLKMLKPTMIPNLSMRILRTTPVLLWQKNIKIHTYVVILDIGRPN